MGCGQRIPEDLLALALVSWYIGGMTEDRRISKITIHTDGSCRPNPGTGGWAAVLAPEEGETRTLSGGEQNTTNNRMEVTAALKALQSLTESHRITLCTDSTYLKDGITRWITNWQKRGWTTITGEPVRNRDLWEELASELQRHSVEWQWVKGHGSDTMNLLADELAGSVHALPDYPLNDNRAVHIFIGISWRQSLLSGAWAAIFHYRGHYRQLGRIHVGGSSNCLHISSAVAALGELKRSLPVHLYTTSGYLRDGASHWLRSWAARDWYTREGRPVSNREAWQELANLLQKFPVSFHLVDKQLPPCHFLEAKEISREVLAGLDEGEAD